MMLQHVFEAAIRSKGSDQIVETLEDYVEQGKQPPRFLLQRISSIKDLPDRIYVLLKEHFPNQGAMLQKARQFTQPHFRGTGKEAASVKVPSKTNHKRIRLKKNHQQTLKYKDRKSLSQVS